MDGFNFALLESAAGAAAAAAKALLELEAAFLEGFFFRSRLLIVVTAAKPVWRLCGGLLEASDSYTASISLGQRGWEVYLVGFTTFLRVGV